MKLNGDLVLLGFGQLKNLRPENVAADPSTPGVGQLWFNSQEVALKYFDGASIKKIATGGDANAILAELDNVESAIGLNADGSYSALAGSNYLSGSTTVRDSLAALDAALRTAYDNLVSEAARATGAEQAIAANLASEIGRATAAEDALTAAVQAEVSRATAAEGTLTSNLASEVSRATAAEQTLTDNLSTEVARATAAEQANATAISNEVARATAAEGVLTSGLAAEVSRATGAEATLTSDLAAEVSRASGVEAGLNTRLASVEGAFVNKDGSVAMEGNLSLGGFRIVDVLGPEIDTDAANKGYVDQKVADLGNVFNYVSTIVGGATEEDALDLDALAIVETGSYYRVTTAGYVKAGASTFYVNTTDGVVKNTVGAWDKFDNTDPNVAGSAGYIHVDGTVDTGFVVDIDSVFKGRVSTLESGLSAEVARATAAENQLTSDLLAEISRAQAAESTNAANIAAEVSRATGAEATLTTNLAAEAARAVAAEGVLTSDLAAEVSRATGAEATLTADLASEVSRATAAEAANASAITAEASRATTAESALATSISNEVTRATGVEAALQAEVDAVEAAVGLNADGSFAAVVGSNYLGSATSVVGLAQNLDVAVKALNDKLADSYFLYNGDSALTDHVVLHGLGTKYLQVSVVDSDDNVIIPDNIHFDSNSQLTVSFTSAATCKVIVTGKKA